jgi:hypothetical protein
MKRRRPKYSKDLARLFAQVKDKVDEHNLRWWAGDMPPIDYHRLLTEALLEYSVKAAEYMWPGFQALMRDMAEHEEKLTEWEKANPEPRARA